MIKRGKIGSSPEMFDKFGILRDLTSKIGRIRRQTGECNQVPVRSIELSDPIQRYMS